LAAIRRADLSERPTDPVVGADVENGDRPGGPLRVEETVQPQKSVEPTLVKVAAVLRSREHPTTPGEAVGSQKQITSNAECGAAGGERTSYNYCGGLHYCCGACNGSHGCRSNGGWMLQACACTDAVHMCGHGSTVQWLSDGVWQCHCGADSVAWDAVHGHSDRAALHNCYEAPRSADECCGTPPCKYTEEVTSADQLVTTFRSDEAKGCMCRPRIDVVALIGVAEHNRSHNAAWHATPTDAPQVRGGNATDPSSAMCRGLVAQPGELPHRVFYTAKKDPTLRNLTEEPHQWPPDYTFEFFNDIELEDSVVRLSRLLAKNGVPDFYRAYKSLRPWAFRADMWRYAILWACGGIYLDAKLRLIGNVSTIFPAIKDPNRGDTPLLLVGNDIPESHMVGHGYWNGLLAATPRHPALLDAITQAIRNAKHRTYYQFDRGGLNITGPGCLWHVVAQSSRSKAEVKIVFDLDETWPNNIKHNKLLRHGDKAPLFRIDIPLHLSGKSNYWSDDKHCRVYCSDGDPCPH